MKPQLPESNHVLLVDDVPKVSDAYFNIISLRKLDRFGNELKEGGGKITMLVTDFDFKLDGTMHSARAQSVSH